MFLPSTSPLRDLKSWTAHTLYPAGGVVIDAGAHHVLSRQESGGRLLPAGVLSVSGAFASGQAVRILALRRSRVDDAAAKSPSTEILTPQTSPIISAPNTSTSSFCVPTSPKDEFQRAKYSRTTNYAKTLHRTALIITATQAANTRGAHVGGRALFSFSP